MKIIIAIDNFRIGGAERVASLIANHLAESHDVHALIFDGKIRYDISSKVKLHIIDENSSSNRAIRIVQRVKRYHKIFKKINPDAIYSFGYVGIYAVVANKFLCIRIKNFICSERTDPSKEPANRFLKLIRNWAYRNCNTLVCQTPDVVDYFNNIGLKVDFSVIPNPVKSGLPSWQGIDSQTFITACRLEPQKNLDLMIDGFAEFSKNFPDYELHIYGDGYLKSHYEQKIKDIRMEEKISIFPFSTDIHSIMASSLAYISTSDYEGISNSMLESLAIGLPTICTDCPVGGARMFIQNGVNGYLSKVGDKDSLVKSLSTFIDNPDKNYLSKNSMKISDTLSTNRIVAKWVALIK